MTKLLNNIYKFIPKYVDMENDLIRYYKFKEKKNFRIAVGTTTVCLFTGFLFRNKIERYFGNETVKVASMALNDDNFKVETSKFINNITTNEEVINQIKIMLINIISSPESQKALCNLWTELCKDKNFLDASNKLIIQVLSDPEVQKQFNNVLNQAVNETIIDEKIKENTRKSLLEIFWKSVKFYGK